MPVLDLRNEEPVDHSETTLKWCDDDDLNLRQVDLGVVIRCDVSGHNLVVDSVEEAEALIRCFKTSIKLGWYK